MTSKEYYKWAKKFLKQCKRECKKCCVIEINVPYYDSLCRHCERKWQKEIDNKKQEVLEDD